MDERQMVNMRRFSAAMAGGANAAHLPSDTYEDFAEWRSPRPAATVGDAMLEFSGTSLDTLLVWFARCDRGTAEAARVATRLGVRPGAAPGTREWLLLAAGS